MQPFFSIVIPTYNRVKALDRSINSVLRQSFSNFELIVVDNGSTDNTSVWIQDNFNDKRIVYHYQNGSGTPASPRNTGIILAKGKWICFLDSDDMWKQKKLEKLFEVIKLDKNLDIICHNERLFYEDKDTYGKVMKYGPISENMYMDLLIIGNRLSTSATSVRSRFIKKNQLLFNELKDFSMVEDYDLWLNMSRLNARFKFLKECLGFYTIGNLNMIGNSRLYYENLKNLLEFHTFNIQTFELNKNKLWNLLEIRLLLLRINYLEKSLLSKLKILLLCIKKSPINFVKYVFLYLKTKLVIFS
jgi:glycosyltransferase involved in cell wall biosynthesis